MMSSDVMEGDESVLKDKAKLLEMEDVNGNNTYMHLKACIKNILSTQKITAYDEFETISSHIKKMYAPVEETPGVPENPINLSLAKIQKKLFMRGEEEEEEPVLEENAEHPLPNLMKSARQFESAGIGLDICTTVRLNMAIKSLVNAQPVKTAKFWGKIYGLMQNYYVVEAEFQEGEDTEDQEEDEEGKEEGDAEGANDDSEDGENDEETKDVLPKSKWKQPPKVPREPNQVGVNKKVYFVCHEPGLRWIRLPPVTPQQIRVARSIRRLFTGNLDAPVKSYPPFPGNEANYLRAQIARISASTQISPEGYYHFGNEDEEEEEMEDEEGGERQRYTKNEEYEPLTVDELANRNLEHWVHHTSYILPQGRVTWWNPSKNLADDLEEFNEEEENGEGQELPPQPERGPPILTSIASDAPLFGNPPWTVRKSSRVLPEFASVILSSGLWPGAHALAWDKDYDNLYIGWGLKATGPGFHPHLPSSPLTEYQDVPEISEATDPTPQEEAALRAIGNAGEGEEAEGQEEAEEDEQAEDAGEQE